MPRSYAWCRPASGEVTFGPETKRDERSVSKSVTALVVGIAIDRGWIKGVDEPVLSLFPEYAELRTPEKDRITLRHLLTMSTGLEWHEFGVGGVPGLASPLHRLDAANQDWLRGPQRAMCVCQPERKRGLVRAEIG